MLNQAQLKPLPKREQIRNWLCSLGEYEKDIEAAFKEIEEVGLEVWFEKVTLTLVEKQQATNPLICPICHGGLSIETDNEENIFYENSLTGTLYCNNNIPASRFYHVPADLKPQPYTYCDFTAYWDLDVKPYGGHSYGITYEHNFHTLAQILVPDEDDDDEP